MAVIDAAPHFETSLRGYDRTAVDAVIRAEAAHLEQLNARIAVLEQQLAAVDRAAQFREDDPQRTQVVQAAADLVIGSWDYARRTVAAEEAAADERRAQANALVSAYLAEVFGRAEAEERRVQAMTDDWLASAREEADRTLAAAEDFVANVHPMAERLLADSADAASQSALAAENAMHTAHEAIEKDLMQRQTAADHALRTAQQFALQARQEAGAVADRAARMQQSTLGQAQALATELSTAVDDQIAALEEEADLAMAELAEHMAAMSAQLNSARKPRAARAPRKAAAAKPAAAMPADPMPAPVPADPMPAAAAPAAPAAAPAAAPPRTMAPVDLNLFPSLQAVPAAEAGSFEPLAPEPPAAPAKAAPKAKAPAADAEAAPAKPKTPRKPAATRRPKVEAKQTEPAVDEEDTAVLPVAARSSAPLGSRPSIKVAAAAPSIIRL